MKNIFFHFIGGSEGEWSVTKLNAVRGDGLEHVSHLKIKQMEFPHQPDDGKWVLRGFTSNLRYTERREQADLSARQENLGRHAATCAALIPIRKSDEWWLLPQDERRRIFEAQSQHIATGMKFLPAVARRLYHSKDIGEPFDFLTWFEFAPPDADAFEELVGMLRSTHEWDFVEREVDIRLTKV